MGCINFKRTLRVLVLIFVTGIFAAGCGAGLLIDSPNGGTGDNGGTGGGDTTNPFATVVPADFSSMSNAQPVVITFSESMDTTSLILGGTMGPESDGGVWSTTTNENDTVTISPTATWTAGVRTLTFNATDTSGNPFSPSISKTAEDRDLTYGVEVLFARSGTSGVCFMNDPCDIATAADTATDDIAAGWSAAEVYVVEGNHQVDSSSDGQVNVSAGVSLSGGYPIVDGEPDWTAARDPVANVTTVTDVAAAGGDALLDPNCPIYALAGVTAASVIDGFRIVGGNGLVSCGIFCNNASPTITNNNINGGDATTLTIAVFNTLSSSPDIQDNTIFGGGTLGGTTSTMGIRNFSSCSPNTQGNNIDGGAGTDASIAISNATTSSPVIDGNDIDGGTATDSRGIDNTLNCSPPITNNVIAAGDGGAGATMNYGIANWDGSAPLIQNNVIDGGTATDVYGISCSVSSPSIYNNTIYGNFANNTNYAIFMVDGGAPAIVNNMMYAQNFAMPNYIAIVEADAGSDPVDVRNNNIFEYSGGVYFDADFGGVTYANVGLMEIGLAGEGITTGGNITEDLSACLDGSDDYRFGLGCDLAAFTFDTSGLNGAAEGWDVLTDLDGESRTVPWSIGPYEYD